MNKQEYKVNDSPKVSIVLPVFNGEKYVSQSIESIINQKFQDWELIIVNDCSTDNTLNIIKKYAELDSRIKIINNSTNLKLPKSLNKGFDNAQGEYFTWTSDDNIYENNAIEELYNFLSINSNVSMVIGDMVAIDENGDFLYKWPSFCMEDMAYHNTVGACFLYRSDIYDKIGKYSEDLFLVEDYEYWLRILWNKGIISRLPHTLYKYRLHAGSLSEERKSLVKERINELRQKHFDNLLDMKELKNELVITLYCEMIEMGELSEYQLRKFRSKKALLDCIKPLDDTKPIIVYGAGNYGKSANRLLKNIAFFADRNIDLVGKKVDGVEVIDIKKLTEIAPEYQIVIAICNQYLLYSIFCDLKRLGITSWSIIQDVLVERGIEYDQFIKLYE